MERVHAFVSENVKTGASQFVAEAEGKIVGWREALPGDAFSGSPHVGIVGMESRARRALDLSAAVRLAPRR